MQLEDLALIGNCQYAALTRRDGAVVWCCLPRGMTPLQAAFLKPGASASTV